MIILPNKCQRGLKTCKPLASIESDAENKNGNPFSYICVGKNDGSEVKKARKQDKYTLCWHNDQVDDRTFWDTRDLTDTASVIVQALSAIGNDVYKEPKRKKKRKGKRKKRGKKK